MRHRNTWPVEWRTGEMGDEGRARRNSVCGQCATAGEEDISNTAIGTELSTLDPFSAEVVNAADYGCDSLGVRRGPCRVIRIDLETGGSTGYVDVPSPCGHAGGLAVGGMLYVADTHTLFATPLAGAFDRGARFRQFSLGPGVIGGFAASTPDGIWLGTYEDGPGRLFHFTAATLTRLFDGETLEASQAATVLIIPDHAQGAAIGSGGLWIARSDWNWGTLDRLDPA